MFSVSIQPQLVIPLNQLAAAVGTSVRSISHNALASRASCRPTSKQSIRTVANQEAGSIDITEEFVSTAEELGLGQLPSGIRVQAVCSCLNAIPPESHTSAQSFFQNKHGFPETQLHSRSSQEIPYDTLQISLPKPSGQVNRKGFLHKWMTLGGHQHWRGFKTKRSAGSAGIGSMREKKDDDSNPGLLKSAQVHVLGATSLRRSRQSDQQPDEMKKLLADPNLSPETQQLIKIAFAEGYAAKSKSPDDRHLRNVSAVARTFFKVLFYIIMGVLAFQFFLASGISSEVKNIGILKREYEINPEEITVTFDDVKGVEEAKKELQDVVDFLRNPEKFKRLGAKLPKGVLLVGPPGIGKTLLARAVAGEASVPFFNVTGSEFDEVFVGTGAKRVRQLFETAKASAPCVIFIDEIDSVGSKRTSSALHPYANQTINQLLSEMDGFTQIEGIIVLGATNRKESLDGALLRPGRFDVEVRVFPPDFHGRKEIFNLYLNKISWDKSVDVDKLARGTVGFTGADIENMVNQAALKAAIENARVVTQEHFDYAKDKILLGPPQVSKIIDDETNQITAYHEAGHTIVAFFTKDATPLHKVTILPRGMTLGHTSFIPEKEEYNVSRSMLMAQMDVLMGGRVAEETILGPEKVTTGCGSDMERATELATNMVKRFGMSEKVGLRVFEKPMSSFDLHFPEISPAVMETVDSEIKRMLQESYDRAKNILKVHAKEHKALAEALLKYEILDAEEIEMVIMGKPLKGK